MIGDLATNLLGATVAIEWHDAGDDLDVWQPVAEGNVCIVSYQQGRLVIVLAGPDGVISRHEISFTSFDSGTYRARVVRPA